MTDIQKIIAQLEAATEPSATMNCRIALVSGWRGVDATTGGFIFRWLGPNDEERLGECPFSFTSIIESAISLIPAGLFWLAGYGKTREDEPDYGCQVMLGGKRNVEGETNVNLAIAICIAALKARDALAGGQK